MRENPNRPARHDAAIGAAVALALLAAGCDDPRPLPPSHEGSATDTDSCTSMAADTESPIDTGSEPDTGSDSDTGDGAAVGEACAVTVGLAFTVDMTGICAAAVGDCTAGTVDTDAQGTCAPGLVCCLDETACEAAGPGGLLTCQHDPCTLSKGLHAGCPADGTCCPIVEIAPIANDGGLAAAGEPCALDLSLAGYLFFELSGECAELPVSCAGGTVPGYENAACDDGLQCCIDTDQCAAIELSGLPVASCQPDSCGAAALAMPAGCPDDQYCCSIVK